MAKLRVHALSMSLDGYAAGPDQSLDNPLGVGAMHLHDWIFATPFGRAMIGEDAGDLAPGEDDAYLTAGVTDIGATIMGRNMFGPVRGDWPDETWTGWWGDDPPFHHPVFVLTHHPRPSVTMAGGTVFHFVDDDITTTLARAVEAAGGADVRLGGGASTVQQYLAAGLVDELHVAVVPVLLGSGERLFDHLPAGWADRYEVARYAPSRTVAHVVLARKA
jgi:dihydrofolate reductase